MIISNKDWWQEESSKRRSLKSCPYANLHTCPRYYESVFLLSQVNKIAGLTKNKSDELDQMLANTSFSALCAEEVPSKVSVIKENMITDGVLEDREDHYLLLKDKITSSSSYAAPLVASSSKSGPQY